MFLLWLQNIVVNFCLIKNRMALQSLVGGRVVVSIVGTVVVAVDPEVIIDDKITK